MGMLTDHVTFDSLHRDRIETDVEKKSVRVDDLDRFAAARPQGSREVSRVAALDHHAAALAAAEECWHGLGYITLKVS